MSCFGSCFGDKSKSKQDLNSSYHAEKEKELVKKKDVIRYSLHSSEKNTDFKRESAYSVSPFKIKRMESSSPAKENFKLDSGNEISRISQLNNIPNNTFGETAKDNSPLKRMMTKQRFTTMNMNILQTLTSKMMSKRGSEDTQKSQAHWEKKDKFKCLFCGGANCKHENYLYNKNSAIQGLHSDFITEDIIASQRPSTILINKFNLIQTFKQMNIGLIVNVQREGEHPYCGPNKKLEDSGFTYNPHHFLSGDVKCKVSGWKDMSVPQSVNFIIDIVKEMCVMIKERGKKVLVHCHAGYGRTGVIIACYMLYTSNSNKTVEKVVEEIRKRRAQCIQKKDQYAFCEKFKDYITKARILFNLSEKEDEAKKPVEYFLKFQKEILFGEECERFDNIPKLLYVILERILDLKKQFNVENKLFYAHLNTFEEWNHDHEEVLSILKKSLNRGDYNFLNEIENIGIICQVLYDWLEDDVEYIINPNKIVSLKDDAAFKKGLEQSVENAKNTPNLTKSKETRRMLFEFLKKELANVEYETILAVAHFFESVFPEAEEDMEAFSDIVDRFSVHLLGYKYAYAYNVNDRHVMNHIVPIVTVLYNIILLFIIGIKNDFNSDGSFFLLTSQKVNHSSNRLSDSNFSTVSKQFARANTMINVNPPLQLSEAAKLLPNNDKRLSIPMSHEGMIFNNSNHITNSSQTNNFFKVSGVQGCRKKNSNFSELSYDFGELTDIKNMNIEQQEKYFFKLYNTLNKYFGDENKQRKGSEVLNFSDISNIAFNNESPLTNNNHISNYKKRSYNSNSIQFIARGSGTSTDNNLLNISDNEDNNVIIDYIKNFVDRKCEEGGQGKVLNDMEKKSKRFSMIYTPHEIIKEEDNFHQETNRKGQNESKRTIKVKNGKLKNKSSIVSSSNSEDSRKNCLRDDSPVNNNTQSSSNNVNQLAQNLNKFQVINPNGSLMNPNLLGISNSQLKNSQINYVNGRPSADSRNNVLFSFSQSFRKPSHFSHISNDPNEPMQKMSKKPSMVIKLNNLNEIQYHIEEEEMTINNGKSSKDETRRQRSSSLYPSSRKNSELKGVFVHPNQISSDSENEEENVGINSSFVSANSKNIKNTETNGNASQRSNIKSSKSVSVYDEYATFTDMAKIFHKMASNKSNKDFEKEVNVSHKNDSS